MRFDFHGFKVFVDTDNEFLKEKLLLDFNYFIKDFDSNENLYIHVKLNDEYKDLIPQGVVAKKQTINSITYDVNNLRFNDYYGDALSIFNYLTQKCEVYSHCEKRLHEIVYLIILSRQGKWLDKNGFHKIHAMGVSKNNKNLILMLPMKGGKTTTFTKFLEDESFDLISDDTPIVDSRGDIKSFPIRIGIEDNKKSQKLLEKVPDSFKSEFFRKQYGAKKLIDITYFEQRLTNPTSNKTILVQGFRCNSNECEIKKIGKLKMFKYLVINMIVGIGLPMIIEYFLESSLKDKFINLGILVKRTYAATRLLIKSQCYEVYLGTDVEKNVKELKLLL